jgi:hypothetical protein
VQISKALVYSKIQFLLEKEFSSDFGPSGPASVGMLQTRWNHW